MKVDKDLLKLYSIHSVSGTDGEKEICDWLCKRLKKLGRPFKRVNNTIYSFKKDNKVLLSAHLDQVKTAGRAVHFELRSDCYIHGYNKYWQSTSLGADDKNGVWIILKLVEAGCCFDFIISESEEIGCLGIKSVESLINSSTAEYCLVLDRKGNCDILNRGSCATYCESLASNLKNFFKNGYVISTGSISDTQIVCKYKESVNMSVAYFHPHQDIEHTDYRRLQEILEDVKKVVDGMFIHYPAKPSAYYKDSSTTTYNKGRGYYDAWY